MRLLPYYTITLQTDISLEVICIRLRKQVESNRSVTPFWRSHAPYQGTVSLEGFKIYRVIHYGNSFLPIIKGQFETQGDDTLIHIAMSIQPLVSIVAGLWSLGWYGLIVPFVIKTQRPLMAAGVVITPLLFLGFAWCIFWLEVRRSQRDLERILLGPNSLVDQSMS